MLLQVFMTVPIPTASADEGRASSFMVWSAPKRILADTNSPRVGDMGIDSDGNLHYIWVNKTGTIFYGKTDPNGTFVATRAIGTSNRGYDANPRLSVDEGDVIHITWSNNSGPQMKRVFEYLRLNTGGAVLSIKHGIGGDDIIGFSTGFIVLQYFNDTRAVPDPYGPLSMLTYDLAGVLIQNITVGYHKRNFEHADFLRNVSGNVFIVYMTNETAMNTTLWQNMALPIDQKHLLQGRVRLKCPRMSFDSDGYIQLVWIDGTPNAAYLGDGIWHMRLGLGGNVMIPEALLAPADDDRYTPDDLSILSTRGFKDFPVLASGHYMFSGSGGDEIGQEYFFIQARNDGSVIDSKMRFLYYCSNDTPAMVQSGEGLFSMFYGVKGCFHESGDPGDPPGLYFLRSYGLRFVDIALMAEGISYPGRIFPNESFELDIRVNNLGDWNTSDFVLNITDKATSDLVQNATGNLDAFSNMTFHIPMEIAHTVTYVLEVDPLKNPDVNLTNNKLELTLTPIARPDLAINSPGISFSIIRPKLTDNVELSVLISNMGGLGAECNVTFYDGENGTLIGRPHVSFNTSTTTSSVFWKPKTVGMHTIVINIENVTPSELPEDRINNKANRSILVGTITVPSIEVLTPADGAVLEPGIINITGQAWDPDVGPLEMFIRLDGEAWETVVSEPNATISGYDWYLVWDLTDLELGYHTISAQVKDDIHENLSSNDFKLVEYLVPFTVVDWFPKYDPTINETEWVAFTVMVEQHQGLNISYQWAVDGENVNQTPRLNISAGYNDAGSYIVSVLVSFDTTSWAHHWSLKVNDRNRPPVIDDHTPKSYPIMVRTFTTITFDVNVSDPDGDPVTYNWTSVAPIVESTVGTIKVKFQDDGVYYVNLTVTDDKGASVKRSWRVEVNITNPPCCLPPKHRTNTWVENLIWILIVIIGVIVMVSVSILYWRMGHTEVVKRQQRKDKGEPEEPQEPDGMTPPGRMQ